MNELVCGGRGNDFILAIEAELPEVIIKALLPSQSGPVQNNEERWLRFVRYEIRFEIFGFVPVDRNPPHGAGFRHCVEIDAGQTCRASARNAHCLLITRAKRRRIYAFGADT